MTFVGLVYLVAVAGFVGILIGNHGTVPAPWGFLLHVATIAGTILAVAAIIAS